MGFSTTITSSTILPQPCGNLCPLLALQGCDTLQPGEQCVPELLVDPCVEYSTQLVLQCPDKNTDLWRLPDATHLLPSARCRVCGFGSVDRDQDDRQGYYEADIYFGQNSIELDINEEPIAEYRVYVVDALQRRLGHHVATVQKNAESVGCCRVDAYRAHISTVLPAGFRRFMVVPVSKFGMEMPAGTMSFLA
ncbi:unnamed protein product [Effrenium voratum]|nr:unnamed protein product [Effrenium voratum]